MKSYLNHLECSKCQKTYDPHQLQQLCTCGKPLLARYDLESLKKAVSPEDLVGREASLWRYRELLPVQQEENIVSQGEGFTPLVHCGKTGQRVGIPQLYLKDEGIIPTGTFKARGAAVGISRAKELGVKTLAMPTNGNAGAAWSLYAAKAGLEAVVVMPEDAPIITRTECAISGAHAFLIKGLISDAGKVVGTSIQEQGWFDASTLKEPYRIEGKKTMGLEIAEQFQWQVPDVIIYPTGGGVGLIGIYKALEELRSLGWIGDKKPRLVAAQAKGCAPIVKAWEAGEEESHFFENSITIAFGINVPKALGDYIVLEAIYNTMGCAVAVEEEDILRGMELIAREDGQFICPEGACALMAAAKLRKKGWIKEEEQVVVLNTGMGIKYPDAIKVQLPYVEKGASLSLT